MLCEVCERRGSDFHCRVRTVTISQRAMPSRRSQRPRSERSRGQKDNSNAWERGVVTESAPDGSRVPLLDDRLQPIGLKQWANEPKWREAKRRLDAERASKGN